MSVQVQLDELSEALQRRGAPLTPESAYFIALQAVEAMRDHALVIDPAGVEVDADGLVHLNELCSPAGDDPEALRGVVSTLLSLLSPPPMDVEALRARVEAGEVATRSAMLAELSALLVPFNRGAAQRMLGRLVREAKRPEAPPREEPAENDADDDGEDIPPPSPDAYTLGGRTEPDGDVRDDWDVPARRKGPSAALTAATVVLAVALLAGAVWFLMARLRA